VLSAICDFPNVNLKEHVTCCSKLKKIASEMHKMLKTAFDDNTTGRTQTFEWVSKFKHGKLWVENCVYIIPPQVTKTKMLTNFAESLILQKLLAAYASHME